MTSKLSPVVLPNPQNKKKEIKSRAEYQRNRIRNYVRNIVQENYDIFIMMKLKFYPGFHIGYDDATRNTQKFQEWKAFYRSQQIGSAIEMLNRNEVTLLMK